MAMHDCAIFGHGRATVGRWLGLAENCCALLLYWAIGFACQIRIINCDLGSI
jgi:hypothetical protein